MPQLLDIIKEAQTMLDCGGDQSPGGDQSNSPDSDPSAESTYGLEARVPARVLNTEMSEAALLEAVRGLRVAEPGLGFKPLAKLRAQQPDLGAATKEVRVALNTLKVESEAAKTATAPPAANQGDEYHELMAEGSRYASEQDWRKAGKAYREAIALRPDRPEAYFNLGGALGNSGHYVEAAQRFLEAMERFPVGSEHWAWATADAFEMLRLDECAEVVKPEWWNDEGLKALSARVLRAAPNEESPIDMRAYVLSGFSDAWEMGPRSAAELKEAAAHFDRSAALCDAPVWKVELSSLADECRSLAEAI